MAENTTKTAVKAPKKSWFKGMKSEFKKIIWPDKESLAKESVTVIVISAVLALIIALIDAAVKYGLGFIIYSVLTNVQKLHATACQER